MPSYTFTSLTWLQKLYTPMMYAGGMSDEAREARRKKDLPGTESNGRDATYAITFLASDDGAIYLSMLARLWR